MKIMLIAFAPDCIIQPNRLMLMPVMPNLVKARTSEVKSVVRWLTMLSPMLASQAQTARCLHTLNNS